MEFYFYISTGLAIFFFILSIFLTFLLIRGAKVLNHDFTQFDRMTAEIDWDKYKVTQLFLKALSREIANELMVRNPDNYYKNFKKLHHEWLKLKELNSSKKEEELKKITDKYAMHFDFSSIQDNFYSHEKYKSIFDHFDSDIELFDLYRNIRIYSCLMHELGNYRHIDGSILKFGLDNDLEPDQGELEELKQCIAN